MKDVGALGMPSDEYREVLARLDEHTRLLTKMDTSFDTLTGPRGRIENVEEDTKEHEKRIRAIETKMWTFGGIITAVAAFIHLAIDWFRGK